MSGGRWIAQYPGGGVRLSLDVERDRQQMQVSLSVLRRTAGDHIVAALCRCLAGCDRMTSLAHLSMLSAEKYPDETSVARFRNIQTIALLMFGLMHELAKALGRLRNAGIERALTDLEPWQRIDEVRKRWLQETASRLRNNVAFHLGDKIDAGQALDALAAHSDARALSELDGDRLTHARHPIGEEMLLAGLDVDEKKMYAIGLQAPHDSLQVTVDLLLIARDLLHQAGARM